jgi:hypothetical protein
MRIPSAARMLLVPTLLFTLQGRLQGQGSAHPAGHDHADPDKAVAGGGKIPAGWSVRPDGNAGTANVKIAPMGSGMRVTLGPAVILYRASQEGKGPFHTLATFTQMKPAAHPEGYGLFYGGTGLDGAGQKYTYFLVRQDGTYLVKQREGDKTTEITKGWAASPAVHKPDAQGTATNMLEIDHKQDPSKYVFLVNGEPVYSLDAKASNADGAVGLRINHNLDVRVEGFDVHR